MTKIETQGRSLSETLGIKKFQPLLTLNYAQAPVNFIWTDELYGLRPEFKRCLEIQEQGEFVDDPDRQADLYTLSGINSRPKYTKNGYGCLLITLYGESLNGKTVSALVHAAPGAFDWSSRFKSDYPEYLRKFAQQTRPGTRSSLITGGSYVEKRSPIDPTHPGRAAEWLVKHHRNKLRIPTTVISPKTSLGLTSMYVDTPNRKLFVFEEIVDYDKIFIANFQIPRFTGRVTI